MLESHCYIYVTKKYQKHTCQTRTCYHRGIIVDTVKVTSLAHWTPDELDAELQKHCSHLWKNLIEIRLHVFPDPVAAVDAGWEGWKNLTVGLWKKFKTKRGLTKCSSVNAPLPFPKHITVRFKTSAVIRSPIFVLERDVSQTWCHEHQQTGWFRYGLHMWVVCWESHKSFKASCLGSIVLRWWLHTENLPRIIMYVIPALQEWRIIQYILVY